MCGGGGRGRHLPSLRDTGYDPGRYINNNVIICCEKRHKSGLTELLLRLIVVQLCVKYL